MAKLTTYEQQVNPGDFSPGRSPRDAARPSGGGVGAAISGIGNELLLLGREDDRMARERQRIEDQDALSRAHIAYSDFQMQQFTALNNAQQAAPADPSSIPNGGFTLNFMAGFEQHRQKFVGDIANPKAQQWAAMQTASYGRDLYDRSFLWEGRQRSQYRLDSIKKMGADKSAIVAGDETLYPQLTAELADYAKANLPAELQAHALDPALQAMRASAFDGWAARNPRLAQGVVNSLLGISPKVQPQTAIPPTPPTSPSAIDLSQVEPSFGTEGVRRAAADAYRSGLDSFMVPKSGGGQLTLKTSEALAAATQREPISPVQLAQSIANTITDVDPPLLAPAERIKVDVTAKRYPQFMLDMSGHELFAAKARADHLVAQDQGGAQHELRTYLHNAAAQADHGVAPMAPDADLVQRAVGPERAPQVLSSIADLQSFGVAMGKMQTMTPAEMDAAYTALAPTDKSDPAWADRQKAADHVKAAGAAVLNARLTDHMAAANAQGIATIPPLDWNDPAALKNELAARQAVAIQMATKYGGATFSALTKAESKAYGEGWSRLTTSDQRSALLALHQSLSDPRVYRDTIAHFVGGSPAIAAAADLAARSSIYRAPDGTPAFDVAFGLLDGERLLHPTKTAQLEGQARGAYKLPPTSGAAGMDQEIAKQIGPAFLENLDGYERAKQAIYAYYAHLSNNAGAVDEPQYDTSRLRQAIDTVVGERSKWAASWMPWSGQTVLRPWGMADGEFAARISNDYDAAMIAAKLKDTPADDKSRMALVRTGEFSYGLRVGNKKLTYPGTDRGIVLDISTPEVQP
jgi:hypothetical protein